MMQSYSEPSYSEPTGSLSPLGGKPLPTANPEPRPTFSVGNGLLTWFVSVALMVVLQVIAVVIYFGYEILTKGRMPQVTGVDWPIAMLGLASTVVAHLLTLAFCFYVLNREPRPWTDSLAWHWHPRFRWPQAVILAVLMMGLAILFAKVLPHQKTEMEKMLELGFSVRLFTAFLAVATAPLVEEIVHRGILYPSIAHRYGVLVGILVSAGLFAGLHIYQYRESPAALATIILLSLVLTGLRAYTGKLLPCIATHLVYNGIQSIALLAGLSETGKLETKEALIQASAWLAQWLG